MELVRAVAGALAMVALAAVVNLYVYGVPLPYVGYLYGTSAAQDLTQESSFSWRLWVALPAILFDRVFGIAGTAPWLFLSVLGMPAALRAARDRLLPRAVVVAANLIALSLFRYWEGGYAPPNRYLAEHSSHRLAEVRSGRCHRPFTDEPFLARAIKKHA